MGDHFIDNIITTSKELNEIALGHFNLETYCKDLRKKIKYYENELLECKRREAVLLNMHNKINNWNPISSEDLMGLKYFMLDQLDISSQAGEIEFLTQIIAELKNNLKVASKKYKIEREQRIKYLLEDLENNVMQLKNMQVQRQKTNKWLKAVYQAIKQK